MRIVSATLLSALLTACGGNSGGGSASSSSDALATDSSQADLAQADLAQADSSQADSSQADVAQADTMAPDANPTDAATPDAGATGPETGPIAVRPKISFGFSHTLVLTPAGKLWVMGVNNMAQCLHPPATPPDTQQYGVGSVTAKPHLTDITDVADIAAGFKVSYLLKKDGALWGIGNNGDGELGHTIGIQGDKIAGQDVFNATLQPVDGLPDILLPTSGRVALDGAGRVWSWGCTKASCTFEQAPPTPGVQMLTGDGYLLTQDGHIGKVTGAKLKIIKDFGSFTQIGAYSSGVVGLKADGTVWVGGANYGGIHGNGTASEDVDPKVMEQVASLKDIAQIAVGYGHAVALGKDGKVWTWGKGLNNALGHGDLEQTSTPMLVAGLDGIKAVYAGQFASGAWKSDGTLWAWGANGSGQLGVAPELFTKLVGVPAKMVDITF
jgi:alpha-tubulin suppressor-like RCC1 family protein